MTRALTAERNRNGYTKRLYRSENSGSDKGELLAQDIKGRIIALHTIDGRCKVNREDLEAVKRRTFAYLEACAAAEVYPSVMGLAVHGFGISRRRLNQYIAKNASPTVEFLESVKDAISDVLVNESLHNRANPIQVIFQLKNHYDHADRVELQATVPELSSSVAPEDLQRQIEALPDD